MYDSFVDLDELILLCRDKIAKKFIAEAVACYRSGAYRSCIVSTWNAVVFDFIHKLRQLDQVGNGDASQLLKSFENMSRNSDLKKLWDFESKIPETALKQFELISPIEQADIIRLFEDRSRCAHPSMSSLEEPFEATAELARYHMRSAVTHLLQRPPVQGRSALKLIWRDIESAYFPPDVSSAVRFLQKGPLGRARYSLIKDVVMGLSTSLLTQDLEEDEGEKLFIALNAVYLMHRKEFNEVLSEKLSPMILDKVSDEDWEKVIFYLRKVPSIDSINEPCRLKTVTLIQKMNVKGNINWGDRETLVNSAHIDFLVEAVKEKLKEASPEDILELKEDLPDELAPFLKDILQASINNFIDEFSKVRSFETAKYFARKLPKISSLLDDNQKEAILNAFCNNDQLYCSFYVPGAIKHLLEKDIEQNKHLDHHWKIFYERLQNEHSGKFEEIEALIPQEDDDEF